MDRPKPRTKTQSVGRNMAQLIVGSFFAAKAKLEAVVDQVSAEVKEIKLNRAAKRYKYKRAWWDRKGKGTAAEGSQALRGYENRYASSSMATGTAGKRLRAQVAKEVKAFNRHETQQMQRVREASNRFHAKYA